MIWKPASTYSTLPVTPRARSLARNTAVSATSAGSVLRRSGARRATSSRMDEKSRMPRADVVLAQVKEPDERGS